MPNEKVENKEKYFPKAGDEFKVEDLIIKLVEVYPYTSGTRRGSLRIAYRIIYKGKVSPTAHFWMSKYHNINKKIEEVFEDFKATSPEIMGINP